MLALQTLDPNSGPLPSRVTNMASRILARWSRSKVLAMRSGRPMVTFTFDDVPASACERGARILEQHGARGTFYVAGARLRVGEPRRATACIDRSASRDMGERARNRMPYLFASGRPLHEL